MDIDNIEKCRLASEKRWTDIRLDLQRVKDDITAMKNRLDKQDIVLGDLQQLSLNVASLSQNMQQMLDEMKKQNERLNNLEQKPIKRFDGVIDTVIKLLVTAGVTFLLVKLGLQQ